MISEMKMFSSVLFLIMNLLLSAFSNPAYAKNTEVWSFVPCKDQGFQCPYEERIFPEHGGFSLAAVTDKNEIIYIQNNVKKPISGIVNVWYLVDHKYSKSRFDVIKTYYSINCVNNKFMRLQQEQKPKFGDSATLPSEGKWYFISPGSGVDNLKLQYC